MTGTLVLVFTAGVVVGIVLMMGLRALIGNADERGAP